MINDLNNSGVMLARSQTGESSIKLRLFLKGRGLIYALASGRTRFGGSIEPFIWGVFNLKPGKNGGLYLKEVEIKDDMIELRQRPQALLTAVKWVKLLTKYLIPENPDDELLANLYWNMKLLCANNIPVEISSWRFIWRWLKLWGIAPEDRANFKHELLLNIAQADIKDIIDNFKNFNFNNKELKIFADASFQAEKFLSLNN